LETHFYVLYPLLLLARKRYAPWIICLFLLAVSIVARAIAIQFLPSTVGAMLDQSVVRRYWEWVLGFVVAEQLVNSGKVGFVPPWVGPATLFAAFGLGILTLTLPMGGAIRAYSWPLVFALAVAIFARQRESPSVIERILVWVGFTSYSLYLTHPIAIPLTEFALGSLGVRSAALRAIFDLLVAMLFSTAFFYVVERPFMRRAVFTARRNLAYKERSSKDHSAEDHPGGGVPVRIETPSNG
jgi:peptidoglycan/LPS O-acetylase OafA/YrhL